MRSRTRRRLLVTGILVGGTYALLASGLGLIFGVMRIVNFAQADFMMLAMFAAFILWNGVGLDPFLAIPLVFVAFVVLGMAVHRMLLHARRLAFTHPHDGRQCVVEAPVDAQFARSLEMFGWPLQ